MRRSFFAHVVFLATTTPTGICLHCNGAWARTVGAEPQDVKCKRVEKHMVELKHILALCGPRHILERGQATIALGVLLLRWRRCRSSRGLDGLQKGPRLPPHFSRDGRADACSMSDVKHVVNADFELVLDVVAREMPPQCVEQGGDNRRMAEPGENVSVASGGGGKMPTKDEAQRAAAPRGDSAVLAVVPPGAA